MRMLTFASRNGKEIVRDPLNLAFGLGFPVILMLLLTAIQSNVPVDLFRLDQLTPGIAIFGLSFISLFSGMLIAKDRTSSFMLRLFASPLTAADFILGYTVQLLPMALAQVTVCYGVAFLLGLPVTITVIPAILAALPAMLLFIAIGLLCGTLLSDKTVGGVCGALLTNLSAWLSGTWFDLNLVGGAFKSIADALPFVHAVDAGRAALAGDFSAIWPHLAWVTIYAVAFTALAVVLFTRRMSGDNQ